MLKNKKTSFEAYSLPCIIQFCVFRFCFVKQKHKLQKFGLIDSLKNANNDYTFFGLICNLLFIRQSFDKNEILVSENYPVKRQHNVLIIFFCDFEIQQWYPTTTFVPGTNGGVARKSAPSPFAKMPLLYRTPK